MRNSIITLMILAISSSAFGAEVTANLDRCIVLNAQDDISAESKVAMHFAMPDEVMAKEIIYAELYIPVTIQNERSDQLYEFILFPLLSDWSENSIDFENSEGITDSLSAGAYTVTLATLNEFYLDITSFIIESAAGERANYGLIAVADLLGDDNLQLPENLSQAIKNAARVKIIYK